MKQIFCKDCKHYLPYSVALCSSPNNETDLVTGKPYLLICEDARYNYQSSRCVYCGLEGRFFEEKEIKEKKVKITFIEKLCKLIKHQKKRNNK